MLTLWYNIAPTELITFHIQSFYYYVAPTELKKPNLVPFYYDVAPTELYLKIEKQTNWFTNCTS